MQLCLHACSLDWIQGAIVSAAVIGAALGSATGGAFSDAIGRKSALLLGDLLLVVGAVVMALARNVSSLVAGLFALLSLITVVTQMLFGS